MGEVVAVLRSMDKLGMTGSIYICLMFASCFPHVLCTQSRVPSSGGSLDFSLWIPPCQSAYIAAVIRVALTEGTSTLKSIFSRYQCTQIRLYNHWTMSPYHNPTIESSSNKLNRMDQYFPSTTFRIVPNQHAIFTRIAQSTAMSAFKQDLLQGRILQEAHDLIMSTLITNWSNMITFWLNLATFWSLS